MGISQDSDGIYSSSWDAAFKLAGIELVESGTLPDPNMPQDADSLMTDDTTNTAADHHQTNANIQAGWAAGFVRAQSERDEQS